MARPGRGSDQFPLRLPDGMRERLKEMAAKNGRSLNSEIVERLSETLESDDRMEDPAAAFEVMKPILEMAKADLADRYEGRLERIESLILEISAHLERGDLGETDKRELEGTIAKLRSPKREAEQ